MAKIKHFLCDESGLETVEYAVILGLLVTGTVGLIGTIGSWVSGRFTDFAAEINPPAP